MWPVLVALVGVLSVRGGVAPTAARDLLECASQIKYLDRYTYQLPSDYNRNIPPENSTTVYINLKIKRVSGVDENKQEITLDVFLQVSWMEKRLHTPEGRAFFDLPWDYRQQLWTPDLYISQLQAMRIASVLQEMASIRLLSNGTVLVSIGAMITIKCDMDFVLYPLDVQRCPIDFSSYKYTTQEVHFVWRDMGSPWLTESGVQRDAYRLPKYVVTCSTEQSNQTLFGEDEHSTARLVMRLSRELRGYLLESYLPSSLFVIISWGSFCVIPEIVPGRMVLLVTTLLSLVTMFDTVSTNSPDALELKCIEVWLISCTIFVFLALLEYFVVLFGIRYDKSWSRRRADLRRAVSAAQLAPPPLIINHSPRPSIGSPGPPNAAIFSPQLATEDEGMKQQLSHQTITRDSPIFESVDSGSTSWLARMAARLDRGVMFCGAQHGALDRYALIVFPICFSLFATIYWTTYLNQRNMQK